jgi:hypothetical protein
MAADVPGMQRAEAHPTLKRSAKPQWTADGRITWSGKSCPAADDNARAKNSGCGQANTAVMSPANVPVGGESHERCRCPHSNGGIEAPIEREPLRKGSLK